MPTLKPLNHSHTTKINYLSAAILLVIVILLFTPFWHFGEGETAESVSINSYVWFPGDQRNLEDYFQEALGEKVDLNAFVAGPIMMLVFGAAGVIVCCLKADCAAASLLPIVAGGGGIWAYATTAALRLGSMWEVQMGLCIAALGLGLVNMISTISAAKK